MFVKVHVPLFQNARRMDEVTSDSPSPEEEDDLEYSSPEQDINQFVELGYPDFDTVCELLIVPTGWFEIPSDGTMVFENITQLVSYLIQESETDVEIVEDIEKRAEGRWFCDPAGVYHSINKTTWNRYFARNIESLLLFTDDVRPNSRNEHGLFRFRRTRDMPFLMIVLHTVRSLLQLNHPPTLEHVLKCVIGKTYRASFGRYFTITNEDADRVKAVLKYSKFLKRDDTGNVVAIANRFFKEDSSESLVEKLVYILKCEDPFCCGLTADDLSAILKERGVKAKPERIQKEISRNPAFFDYFGLIGLKTDVEFEPHPPVTNSHSPSLVELVYYHLSLIEEPITLKGLVDNMSGFVFWDKREVTVTERTAPQIAKILHDSPYIVSAGLWGIKFFLVPPAVENTLLDGLYTNHMLIHENAHNVDWQGARVCVTQHRITFWTNRRYDPIRSLRFPNELQTEPLTPELKFKKEDNEEYQMKDDSPPTTDVESPRPKRVYRRRLVRRDGTSGFSESECQEFAAKWRDLIEERLTSRLLTKDEYETLTNTREMERKRPSVQEWTRNFVEAWEHVYPVPAEGQFMSISEFIEYLHGRSLPALALGASDITVQNNDRLVRIIVREALSLSGCFENFSGKWTYLGAPKTFDESVVTYYSFCDMLIGAMEKLYKQNPTAIGFTLQEIKSKAIGSNYMQRMSHIPVVFAVRDSYRFDVIGSKSLYSFPFLRIGDKFALVTHIVKRDSNGQLPLFNPWHAIPARVLAQYAIPVEWIESLPEKPPYDEPAPLKLLGISDHEDFRPAPEPQEENVPEDSEPASIDNTSPPTETITVTDLPCETTPVLNEDDVCVVLDIPDLAASEPLRKRKHRRKHHAIPTPPQSNDSVAALEVADWGTPGHIDKLIEVADTYTVADMESLPFPDTVQIPEP